MIKKIAIIDDDAIFQFTTKITIERLNLAEEVLFFQDGDEIFDFLKDCKDDELPEVLLLDINMPVTDGWDFLEMYKDLDDSVKSKTRIYMLSSSINPTDVEKAEINSNVIEYITKPISDGVLEKLLK